MLANKDAKPAFYTKPETNGFPENVVAVKMRGS